MSKTKVAVVTGGNKGLGYEAARQLARKGYEVYLTARRREEGKKAAERLAKEAGKVRFIYMEVTDPDSIKKAAREIAEQADHVDVLINNVRIYPDGESTILNVDETLLNKSFLTNTVGAILVSQAFWPLLARSGRGRIVNVSSGLGALSEMGSAAPSYSISKAALNAVTRQLSASLKDKGISVNSVCPGWVRTEMGGPNAPRSVEEGASGIVWAATDAAADLTGKFLRDGQVIAW